MLDDLLTAIQAVQARIREHGNSLSQNEYRTRISLIDPILNALGWDVSDPGLVTVEDQYSGGRPDYALLANDKSKPLAFIEAKRLGEPVNAHEDQVFKYTWDRKVFYAGLTDGNRWIFRDVTAEFSHPPREGLLLDVTLSRETPQKCALKLLLLWHQTFTEGDPTRANDPILVEPMNSDPTKRTTESPQTPPQVTLPSPSPSLGWIPLSDYSPGKDDPLPLLLLPREDEKHLQKWYGLLVEIAEWLIHRGLLTESSCPVPGAVRGYSMINSVPQHENGIPLFHPERLSNGLYLNKQGNRDTLLSNAKSLLEHFHQDPASILLKPD